jgi:enoyl-CoA hydratase/carnithine racemase
MDILTQKDNGILSITFNRPEKKNAITAAMYQTMADALRDAETDPAVRAILISGRPEAFTAGNDLEDFMKHAPAIAGEGIEGRSVYQFMQALSACSKPVVAAVSGVAVGIGTTLLMHCDLIYLADNAKLVLPFTQLGLCPEFASSMLLPQIAGYPRAAEKLMLGEAFSAQEAFEMGLASRVLPVDELLPFAQAQAAKLVALPASSIRATKRLMKEHRNAAIAEKMQSENKFFAAMLTAPEAREAFMAFFQKRKPDFSQFN